MDTDKEHSSKLLLYTMQPIEVFEKLKNEGYLYAKSEFVIEEFRDAYAWMINKMNEFGIRKPEKAETPWWAWYRINGKEELNLDELKHCGKAGKSYKLLCIEVDSSEVLLSDFDSWHNVLNDSFYDDSSNEYEYDSLYYIYRNTPKKFQEVIKRCSWNKIFDITLRKNDWFSNGKYVQACFWKLDYSKVVKVLDITCVKMDLE